MATSRSAFSPLPGDGRDGPRLCGVEIEFAGLTEEATARIVTETLGGQCSPDGAHAFRVTDTRIGTIKVELDTALRKADLPMLEAGLDLARAIVPVEIVSDPLDAEGLEILDRLRERLRTEGAQGSRDGLFLGFGVHLNPETPTDPAQTMRIVRAYGLLEDWLRQEDPIDPTRRVLPFVDPWPHRLIDDLVSRDIEDMDSLMRFYARHTTSRNHGLDLLPLFKHACADAFAATFAKDRATSGRPAFHFRLPDCRIDEAEWSLADPWRSWMVVERLAQDQDALASLGASWTEHRGQLLSGRTGWARRVSDVIGARAEALA